MKRYIFGFSKKRLAALALFLAWLLPGLACNIPGYSNFPSGDTEQERIQTAVAEMLATAQVNAASPAPLPGSPLGLPTGGVPATPLPGVTPLAGAIPLPTSTPMPASSAPLPQPGVTSVVPLPETGELYYIYTALAGDTLAGLAGRFNVEPGEIISAEPLPEKTLIRPGQMLGIPNRLGDLPYSIPLLPDSEVIYSPSTSDFNVEAYIANAGGYLSQYEEDVYGYRLTGSQVVRRIAVETSTNPRLLLAFLEFRSGWVFGQPRDELGRSYPIGFYVDGYNGLYNELSLTAKQINLGYYGWRAGTQVDIGFTDGNSMRTNPGLNAGSVALQYLFAQFYRLEAWEQNLYRAEGFLGLYERMFGNAWLRAASVEPLFPAGVSQPWLELPFQPGERWSFTAGPHTAWTTGTPRGALDFAPTTGEPHCAVSQAWVTAAAPGMVVRAQDNAIAVDLDGDGLEQTGWVIIYMHIATQDQVPAGSWVNTNDQIGHPSCQGGRATGSHVHVVRKYNGEWLAADDALPFVLGGWQAYAGERPYEGTLIREGSVVRSRTDGSSSSTIIR